MVKIGKTRTKKPCSRSRKFKKAVLGRPQGAIQKRVQAVGPEKFGIVAVDCAKARSKWMLTDFYGKGEQRGRTKRENKGGEQRGRTKGRTKCMAPVSVPSLPVTIPTADQPDSIPDATYS